MGLGFRGSEVRPLSTVGALTSRIGLGTLECHIIILGDPKE